MINGVVNVPVAAGSLKDMSDRIDFVNRRCFVVYLHSTFRIKSDFEYTISEATLGLKFTQSKISSARLATNMIGLIG